MCSRVNTGPTKNRKSRMHTPPFLFWVSPACSGLDFKAKSNRGARGSFSANPGKTVRLYAASQGAYSPRAFSTNTNPKAGGQHVVGMATPRGKIKKNQPPPKPSAPGWPKHSCQSPHPSCAPPTHVCCRKMDWGADSRRGECLGKPSVIRRERERKGGDCGSGGGEKLPN